MSDRKPLDITRFKENAKEVLHKLKASRRADHSEDLFTMALALSAAVKKVFFEKSGTKFFSEPVVVKKTIDQFMRRMRVDGVKKFEASTLFSAVHLFKNAAAVKDEDPLGVVIVYIERMTVPEVLQLLRYPEVDYDNNAEVLDGTGTIANLITGQFKKELAVLGYPDLELSHFNSYVNTYAEGIDYPRDQVELYEINFAIDRTKSIVVEMVMSPLPKL